MAALLIVDDEPSACLLLDRVLGKAGHQVKTVGTAEAAAELVAGEHFDLLIVDKNLPGASGFDVIAHARTLHPEVAAIMITAYPEPMLAPTVKLQGYLAKPFESPGKIVESVERVLAFAHLIKPARETETATPDQPEAPSSSAESKE